MLIIQFGLEIRDRPTDQPIVRPTDIATYRAAIAATKNKYNTIQIQVLSSIGEHTGVLIVRFARLKFTKSDVWEKYVLSRGNVITPGWGVINELLKALYHQKGFKKSIELSSFWINVVEYFLLSSDRYWPIFTSSSSYCPAQPQSKLQVSWVGLYFWFFPHPANHPSGKISKWPNIAKHRKAKLIRLMIRPHIIKLINLITN